jgi:hypothetical protein
MNGKIQNELKENPCEDTLERKINSEDLWKNEMNLFRSLCKK